MSWLASDSVTVGEFSLSIIAVISLWIVCLVAVRRWNDLLQRPLLWLKWAIPFFFLYVALSEASAIIYLITDNNLDTLTQQPDLYEAPVYMYGVSLFFASIADIFILLCLVELALSLLRALGKHTPNYGIIRYSNFVVMAVLFVLAIVALAESESFATGFLDENNPSWTTAGKLYGAYRIIYWIISLGLVFLSAFVLYGSMRKKEQQNLTGRFLATCLLNLTRATWKFYYEVHYDINDNPSYTFPQWSNPQYVQVVDPILYTWITLAMFAIIIGIIRII